MTKALEGKIALVTGGSRGIGAAIARELAAQGATVAISYVANADKANAIVSAIKEAGGEALALKADQAVEQDVIDLVGKVAQEFGRLDILVNNAGVFETGMIDATLDTSSFARQVRINYEAVVTAIREASRIMSEGGRIISLSSGLALRVGWPGLADYSATKRAIEGYSKGAARDLGSKGITVNVIGTGSIETDMNPADGPTAEAQAGTNALGRYGRPEEIAAVVAFVAGWLSTGRAHHLRFARISEGGYDPILFLCRFDGHKVTMFLKKTGQPNRAVRSACRPRTSSLNKDAAI
jgi:3-oxoacyl-[acyl-carrier protein] reductase